ncbi:glutaredoxin family protein [uncultured Paraglaciecola sp.]|uniref:glutaredoxin family protein n=1 Tax=uncultured Paraglaciecola sp. TaxID=1765024 RepID=UPI002593F3F9|nr:glutaredoxin family protein [uncultured Paraglaciecola sp.]
MALILYSGQECCLCEQAEVLLSEVSVGRLEVTKIDVRSSTELYHLYGARIPVLFNKENGQELPWPFNKEQLVEFLS